MAEVRKLTRHYPKPAVNGRSMRRYEKLDISNQEVFSKDDELNSALSSSFVSTTKVRVLTVEMVLTLESTYMNII